MSICNKIYTLNKIQQKVDHYDTVILNVKKNNNKIKLNYCLFTAEFTTIILLEFTTIIRNILRKVQFSNFFPKTGKYHSTEKIVCYRRVFVIKTGFHLPRR